MQNQVLIDNTSKADFIKELITEMRPVMADLMKESRQTELNSKENWTPKETEQFLKITAVTRWTWTKSGILKSYKIGGRLRYKKNEVMDALLKVEAKRKQ